MNKIKFAAMILVLLTIPMVSAQAAGEAALEELYNKLESREAALLEKEFSHDALLIQRWEYDGAGGFIGGLFSGGAKKKLEKRIAESNGAMDTDIAALKELRARVEKQIFDIASSYQNSGEYRAAIKWYLRLSSLNNDVKFRVGSCHKALGEYGDAIKWFLDTPRTDDLLFEVSDCYRLWGHSADEVRCLFDIVSSYSNSAVDNKALARLTQLDYPEKLSDFPEFNLKLYRIFMNKSFYLNSSSWHEASGAYRDAVKYYAVHFNLDDDYVASRRILSDYQYEYNDQLRILNEQHRRAVERYEEMLNEAHRNMEHARHEFDRARDQGMREYENKLRELHGKVKHWEGEVARLKSANSPQPEIDSAMRWLNQYRNELQRFNSPRARDEFIRDFAEPAHRRMMRAREDFDRIQRDRDRIIEDMIRPYKDNVEKARRALEYVERLHQENFAG